VEYFEAWHRGDRTLFELHVRGGSGLESPDGVPATAAAAAR
jgi:hypothetical protein